MPGVPRSQSIVALPVFVDPMFAQTGAPILRLAREAWEGRFPTRAHRDVLDGGELRKVQARMDHWIGILGDKDTGPFGALA